MPAAPAETKKLLWSQEFNSKAGTPVSKTFWTHDIGDGTEAGIPGWGNGEREYYIQDALKHDGKGAHGRKRQEDVGSCQWQNLFNKPIPLLLRHRLRVDQRQDPHLGQGELYVWPH